MKVTLEIIPNNDYFIFIFWEYGKMYVSVTY